VEDRIPKDTVPFRNGAVEFPQPSDLFPGGKGSGGRFNPVGLQCFPAPASPNAEAFGNLYSVTTSGEVFPQGLFFDDPGGWFRNGC
jgi:hypothetical protein